MRFDCCVEENWQSHYEIAERLAVQRRGNLFLISSVNNGVKLAENPAEDFSVVISSFLEDKNRFFVIYPCTFGTISFSSMKLVRRCLCCTLRESSTHLQTYSKERLEGELPCKSYRHKRRNARIVDFVANGQHFEERAEYIVQEEH